MVMRAKPEGSAKLHPLNMRTTKATRELLEQAAAKSGRSLQREVEARLEQSLLTELYIKHQWGTDVFNIAESMAKSLWHIERENRNRWIDDEQSFSDFKNTTVALIEAYRALVLRERSSTPDGALAGMSDADRARCFAALGGIAPPRPRDQPVAEFDEADRSSGVRDWHARMDAAGSRPLPIAAEIYSARKSQTAAAKKNVRSSRS